MNLEYNQENLKYIQGIHMSNVEDKKNQLKSSIENIISEINTTNDINLLNSLINQINSLSANNADILDSEPDLKARLESAKQKCEDKSNEAKLAQENSFKLKQEEEEKDKFPLMDKEEYEEFLRQSEERTKRFADLNKKLEEGIATEEEIASFVSKINDTDYIKKLGSAVATYAHKKEEFKKNKDKILAEQGKDALEKEEKELLKQGNDLEREVGAVQKIASHERVRKLLSKSTKEKLNAVQNKIKSQTKTTNRADKLRKQLSKKSATRLIPPYVKEDNPTKTPGR